MHTQGVATLSAWNSSSKILKANSVKKFVQLWIHTCLPKLENTLNSKKMKYVYCVFGNARG